MCWLNFDSDSISYRYLTIIITYNVFHNLLNLFFQLSIHLLCFPLHQGPCNFWLEFQLYNQWWWRRLENLDNFCRTSVIFVCTFTRPHLICSFAYLLLLFFVSSVSELILISFVGFSFLSFFVSVCEIRSFGFWFNWWKTTYFYSFQNIYHICMINDIWY